MIAQELEPDSRSVAVPIFIISGQVVAAINVGVHASRATIAQIRENFVPPMLVAQAHLREILP